MSSLRDWARVMSPCSRRIARALHGAILVSVLASWMGACTHRATEPPSPSPVAKITSSESTEIVEAPTAEQIAEASHLTSCVVNERGRQVLGMSEPSVGPDNAPVTMLAFTDLQCPFCRKAHDTLVELSTHYGSKLRIVWKHQPLPMHRRAFPAAELAQGVYEIGGARPFWKFVDLVFESQGDMSDETLLDIAGQAGLQARSRLQAGLENRTWKKKVDDDVSLAAAIGSRGTPHFYINGRELSGAQPLEKFEDVIDQELALATSNGTRGGTPAMLAACEKMRAAFAAFLVGGPSPSANPDRPSTTTAEMEDDATVWKIPVAGSPSRGPDTALVTIVELADYQCPFCKRVETTLGEVRKKYGDTVRIVWKDNPLPFHVRAEPSAQLAREALAQKGVTGFWAVHDALFASAPNLSDEDLLALASANGVNVTSASTAISTHKHKKAIDADLSLADDFHASGTPHFFINGRRIVGAQPLATFSKIIDEETVKAQALVAKGTAPRSVYDRIIANATGPVLPEKKSVPLPTAGSHAFRGPSTAKVTIQMFADFQCPFCERARATMDQITAAYPTSVRILWRHMPLAFHVNAMLAAEAAEEAFVQGGNKAFWAMHDLLFKNRANQGGLERAALDAYAIEIGLDAARFKTALDGHTHEAKVKADVAVASAVGITGTPSFVINGYYVSGAQPFAKFKKVIDLALSTP